MQKMPWKRSTNPFEIPDGYCKTKHKNLSETIAEPGVYPINQKEIKVMACHESDKNYCVGWLHNQLGPRI